MGLVSDNSVKKDPLGRGMISESLVDLGKCLSLKIVLVSATHVEIHSSLWVSRCFRISQEKSDGPGALFFGLCWISLASSWPEVGCMRVE